MPFGRSALQGEFKEQEKSGKDTTLVYGKNAVTELLKSGGAVDTLYVQDTMQPKQIGYYTALAKEAGAVVKRVRAAKLDSCLLYTSRCV